MSKSILQKKRILTKAGGGSSLATPVSVANGGTGISSYAIGDIIYASGATTLSKLPIGTASQQLRVNAGATALEYFTPTAGGVSIGTTAITSGIAGRLLYQNASNVVAQNASYYVDDNTATNYRVLVAPGKLTASFTGTYITLVGYNAGSSITSGATNVAVGSYSLNGITTGDENTAIGHNSLTQTNVSFSTAIGSNAGRANTGNYGIYVGHSAGQNSTHSNCVFICATNTVASTATHQGFLGGNSTNSYIDNWYFNGVTHSAAYSTTLNACGGSGTNNAGASLTIAGGKGTGNAAGGNVIFQTSTTLGSGTTLQTLATRLTIGELRVTAEVPIKLMGYTVATLPAGAVGDMAYVTDALAPAFLVAIAGGGAIVTPVFYDGVNWVAH
jgi:hypothetical protein